MQFAYTGNNSYFLEQSLFDLDGALSVDITSVTPTEIVFTHTQFTEAGVSVTLNGAGFAASPLGFITTGQITSIEFNGLGIRQGTITNINWSAQAFQSALFDIDQTGDFTAIAALFNSAGPIAIDASDARSGFDQEIAWEPFLPLLSQPITVIGSPFDDSVSGGSGDDIIDTRNNGEDGDRISGSEGDDTIFFDLPQGSSAAGYILDYDQISAPVIFDVDGTANTGSISGTGFSDTLENVNVALGRYLGLEGTAGADSYDIRLDTGQVLSLIGGPGADSYVIEADGAIPILDFLFSDATSGLDLDFATGTIADDGFGFAETLDLTGTPFRTILFATDNNDRVSDGAGNQLVRFYDGDDVFLATNTGADSVDGGNGTDTVRFDTMAQGQATLTFESGVSTLVDRSNPGGSTALLNVEAIETQGGVQIELNKHDGISLISAENLTTLTELYIAYFNRAADALGLSFWATAFQKNGFSFEEIADLFFTQPETVALYSDVSDGDFVQAVYNNVLGRDADQAGFDFWTGQLATGNITESGFILDLLAGARAATGSPADVAYIEAKTDIGLYYAVIQGQNNITAANDVMAAFNGTESSLAAAQSLADTALSAAQSSDTELLMPVIGVVETPFTDIV